METKPAAEEAAGAPLKYQTCALKVSIHCGGCKKKVKKLLHSVDGVYMTAIDPQQHKVTVTGSVDAQTLIKKLTKSGKHAELWPEPQTGNPDDQNKDNSPAPKPTHQNQEQAAEKNIADQLPQAEQTGSQGGANGPKKKKKKKKGQNGNNNNNTSAETGGNNPSDAPAAAPEPGPQVNMRPPDHHVVYDHPPTYYGQPVVSYIRANPSPKSNASYLAPFMHPNEYLPSDPFDAYRNYKVDYDDYDNDYDDYDDEESGCMIM